LSAYLLDVNLLIALAWPNHVHHELAHRWFREHRSEGWATCPVTQSGFVRVSSNRRAIAQARTPAEAIALLQRIVALPHHEFWTDDVAIAVSEHVAPQSLLTHGQVTDAHLIALALGRGGRLATLDAGISRLVPPSQDPARCVTLVR
jgi:toxin-antitoxin system PIN domain toxin